MTNAFRMDELDGGIGLVTFDLPDKKVNTLSRAVLEELGQHVAALDKRTDLVGLLFRSGKPGQYVAGADLNELGGPRSGGNPSRPRMARAALAAQPPMLNH